MPIHHFSVVTFLFEQREYLVFDIPGKYLKRGDILCTLTGGGSWLPGHVGMYAGTKDPVNDGNDGTNVVESTSASEKLEQKDGVQFTDLPKFMTLPSNLTSGSPQHIYLGARRPRHLKIAAQDRASILAFAISKTNSPYLTLGSSLFTSDRLGYSCVGLIDASYKSVGLRISELPEPAFLPIRVFGYTRAVDEVTVSIGETYIMPVRGVLKTRPELSIDYEQRSELYTITLESDPSVAGVDAVAASRAKIDGLNRFLFTPSSADVNLTHKFIFTLRPNGDFRTISAPLYVTVQPKGFIRGNPTITDLPVEGRLPGPSGTTTFFTYASVTAPGSGTFKLSWAQPPLEVQPGVPFDFEIKPESLGVAGSAKYAVDRDRKPPQVSARLGAKAVAFDPNGAYIGWVETGCEPDFECFSTVQNPLSQTVTITPEAPEVKLYVRCYGNSTLNVDSATHAVITWRYQPAP